jgi:aspartate aminotransferase
MTAEARAQIQSIASSRIREVANAAMGRDGVLPFWFGESDQPTPQFIRQAGIDALADGRTFYTHNMGVRPLREAIGTYLEGLHGRAFEADRIAVTSSGVSALMVSMQAILDPGDRVVAVTPVWPNLFEIPRILNAEIAEVPLEPKDGRWSLDLDRLFEALTPQTRLLLINSPNNPTGWMLDEASRDAILEHCRRLGIWVMADDVYERLPFAANRISAPSFLAAAEAEDRVFGINSFSKAWRMTGWRLGWMTMPPEMVTDIGKLMEFNTSCAPDFVQAAAIAALADGEPEVARLRGELRDARDQLCGALARMPGVECVTPDGGMYAFFRIEGADDSVALCKQLIDEAGLGLAPGAAFGAGGEGWLRWCFAARPEKLDDGVARLARWADGRRG